METSNNIGKVVGALLIGTAIGATLGILFAPDKGSETRKKITGKGDELADEVNKKLNDFLEKVKRDFEAVKSKVNDFVEGEKTTDEKGK